MTKPPPTLHNATSSQTGMISSSITHYGIVAMSMPQLPHPHPIKAREIKGIPMGMIRVIIMAVNIVLMELELGGITLVMDMRRGGILVGGMDIRGAIVMG